ncbi:MAG: hypothetical protein AB1449_10480 [Chloroflexota bacterium]
MAEDREARLRDFLEAVWRHPWARFEFLQVESGLAEFRARRARRQAVDLSLVEVERIATKGQPRRPARYSLTPAGAHRMGVPLQAVDRRGSTLLASPHLEKVRAYFSQRSRSRRCWCGRSAPGGLEEA